jgi:hypothetical protein
VHLNFAYRWFCRLELDEPVPNHYTFSKNRHGRFRANLRQSRFQAAKATASCPRYPPECGRQNAVAIDPRSSVVPPPPRVRGYAGVNTAKPSGGSARFVTTDARTPP